MIAGPSQCGKTTFTKLLLQCSDVLFERPIRKIVYCYGQWQECFQDMVSQITFVEGIPEDIPAIFPMGCCPGILVLDDLMRNCSEDERILDLFTKVSHHCGVTCIYLTLNLFPPGKFASVIAFNNPRDTLGFRTLAQQAFVGHVPYVWESFQDATSQPYGYLMLDLHPRTPAILDYVATYCLSHNLCLWSTSTRKPIKQTGLQLSTSVSTMPSCKSGGTMKSRVVNQRGGKWSYVLALRLRPEGQNESGQVLPNNPNSNNTYPFFVRVLKAMESNEKMG